MDNKRAIIVGASSGIGAELTLRLARVQAKLSQMNYTLSWKRQGPRVPTFWLGFPTVEFTCVRSLKNILAKNQSFGVQYI